MNYFLYSVVFIFGLIFGSFANVVIWRFPRGLSVVRPGSYCPKCEKNIPLYHNVPILSYIILRGKCASCGESISTRYPIIELLTALVTLSWFMKFNLSFTAFLFAVSGLLIIIASGIDIDYKILPPQFTYSLIVIGIIFSPFNSFLEGGFLGGGILTSLGGAAVGALLIYIVRFAGTKVFKKEAMGLGDMKLTAGLGALTGPAGVLWTLFIGSLLGSIAGIGIKTAGRAEKLQEIPFGPYLGAGMVIYVNFSGWLKSFFLI
ncbi:MAG: prepilin peptidase [Elusimicrobiota bacterium]|nr:prepilin peptidase [Elusimicrobiota bacterium]